MGLFSKTKQVAPALSALATLVWLLWPISSLGHGGWSTTGRSLGPNERHVRVFDNFTGAEANDHLTPDPGFPGFDGAERAIWKAAVEWSSLLHGDGGGDPHQPGGLGTGGANFDPSWQGAATGVGAIGQNVHSGIAGSNGGVLAYCETSSAPGWRIRYFLDHAWDDDPAGPPTGGVDLQGVATHEYGHALGLGHSTSLSATMFANVSGSGLALRSIEPDDRAGLAAVYGSLSQFKPRIADVYVGVGARSLTISGTNLSPTANTVRFTSAGTSAPGTDATVEVSGVAADPTGTVLVVTIPTAAGAGDVLVDVGGGGPDSLSNPWPYDPSVEGSILGPPLVATITPPVVSSLQPTPQVVVLEGSRLGEVVSVSVDGVLLATAEYQVEDPTRIRLTLAGPLRLGSVPVVVAGPKGSSNAIDLLVQAPESPVVVLDEPLILSATGVELTLAAQPGRLFYLAGSTVLGGSQWPGVVNLGIGIQWTRLRILGALTMPAQGWAPVRIPLSGLNPGTPLHFQGAVFDPATGLLPLESTNIASGSFSH